MKKLVFYIPILCCAMAFSQTRNISKNDLLQNATNYDPKKIEKIAVLIPADEYQQTSKPEKRIVVSGNDSHKNNSVEMNAVLIPTERYVTKESKAAVKSEIAPAATTNKRHSTINVALPPVQLIKKEN